MTDTTGIEDDREMFADNIECIGECRVCEAPMSVHGDNDICIDCAESVLEAECS